MIGNAIFKLSPFSWVHQGVPVSFISIIVMMLMAAALIGIGLAFFLRRDIVAE